MATTKDFAVGIPFYQLRDDIFAETLEGVRHSTIKPSRLIVVNNGGEPRDVRDAEVIHPCENLGCAGAWNLIMKGCVEKVFDVVIILNDDCKVAPDSFEKILAERAPVVLACGFSCFAMRTRTWCQVGPFDDLFWPAYFEDGDYRQRLARSGIPIKEWPVDETETKVLGRTRKPTGIVHGFSAGPREYRRWTDDRFHIFQACYEMNKQRYLKKWNNGAYDLPFDGKPDPGIGGRSVSGAELLR